ncbi:DUF996 domain-containing protein [Thermococcus sp.]
MGVELKTEKTLGLVGSILILVGGFVGVIPYIGAFMGTVSLVGLILVLISLKGIGDKLGDDRPFRYYLYSVIVAFVGAIILIVFVLAGVLMLPGHERFSDPFAWMGLGMIISAFVLFVVFLIVGVYFEKQAWESVYELTGVREFHDTAKWLWWGALTAIILIGLLFLLIAAIYQIIAFANLPESIETERTSSGAVF